MTPRGSLAVDGEATAVIGPTRGRAMRAGKLPFPPAGYPDGQTHRGETDAGRLIQQSEFRKETWNIVGFQLFPTLQFKAVLNGNLEI